MSRNLFGRWFAGGHGFVGIRPSSLVLAQGFSRRFSRVTVLLAIPLFRTPWDFIALANVPAGAPPGPVVPNTFSTPHWCFNRGVAGERSRFIATASAISSNHSDEIYPCSKTWLPHLFWHQFALYIKCTRSLRSGLLHTGRCDFLQLVVVRAGAKPAACTDPSDMIEELQKL